MAVIARRLTRDGAEVCDDQAHIEWLADQAWHLAFTEGQRMTHEVGSSMGHGTEDRDEYESLKEAAQTTRACADVGRHRAKRKRPLP